jgi:glycosyltransferase involved in cell wall biosynthesis
MTISAVIPTCNRAPLLRRAIESVLAQTSPVDEIVVVDDGSTDATGRMVRSLGGRVRCIRQANAGIACARNAGIRAACGDWIALLDDDDEWLPCRIQLHNEAVAACPSAVLTYASYWYQHPDGSRMLHLATLSSKLWPGLRATNTIAASTVSVRKDAVLQSGGFDARVHGIEDWDLWVRLRRQYQFASVSDPVMVYHVTAGSLSQNIDRLLADTDRILESTLLAGLTGVRRRLWRNRTLASQLYAAAIVARQVGSPRHGNLLFRSLVKWPSPLFRPPRYVAAAQALLGHALYSRLTAPWRAMKRG